MRKGRQRVHMIVAVVSVLAAVSFTFGVFSTNADILPRSLLRAPNRDMPEALEEPNDAEDDPTDVPQDLALRFGLPAYVRLPWEDRAEFKEALSRSGATLRMAAFRAILSDPLRNERENIALAAKQLAGSVVPAGALFSQNGTLAPYDEENGYAPGPTYVNGSLVTTIGGGVCKISTGLYNLTVLANLPIGYRRSHSMIVPYVPPGQDATVADFAGLDYMFRNNTDGPVLIWAEMVGDTLYMAFTATNSLRVSNGFTKR